MKIKKWLALALAICLCASLLVGCGGNSGTASSDEPSGGANVGTDPLYGEGDNGTIALKVWCPQEALELTTKQCNDFAALYPNAKFTFEVTPQKESEATENLLTKPDGQADVFFYASDQLNNLVDAGVIYDVFGQPNEVTGYSVDTVKEANSEASINAATVNGKLYSYPMTDNGYMLVYNKKYVTAEQAKTWEGVLEASKAAGKKFSMDAENGFYSCIFPFTAGAKLNGIESYTLPNGVPVLEQKLTEYDEEKAVDVVEAFAKLFHSYPANFQSVGVDAVVTGFEEDTIAAGIAGTWQAAPLSKQLGDNFGVAVLPTINVKGEDMQTVGIMGYKFVGVNKGTKYKETAQLLAYYLTSETAQIERAKELKWGATNIKAAADPEVTSNPMTAISIEESAYFVPQSNMAESVWDACGAFGSYMFAADKAYDRETLKGAFSDMISQIRNV
ncbi:MAG: extracellular solute-binding protein [Oscillospiraceae bacterium]|jgi:arabinogalactan oligomer/maltooligosaccharide transport system substrate-binding protein|nr:extracellular solute-binding protein [Oscillospiraceae bacterium]